MLVYSVEAKLKNRGSFGRLFESVGPKFRAPFLRELERNYLGMKRDKNRVKWKTIEECEYDIIAAEEKEREKRLAALGFLAGEQKSIQTAISNSNGDVLCPRIISSRTSARQVLLLLNVSTKFVSA